MSPSSPSRYRDKDEEEDFDPTKLGEAYERLGEDNEQSETYILGDNNHKVTIKVDDYVFVECDEHQDSMRKRDMTKMTEKEKEEIYRHLWKAQVRGIRGTPHWGTLVKIVWLYRLEDIMRGEKPPVGVSEAQLKVLKSQSVKGEIYLSTHESVIDRTCILGTFRIQIRRGKRAQKDPLPKSLYWFSEHEVEFVGTSQGTATRAKVEKFAIHPLV